VNTILLNLLHNISFSLCVTIIQMYLELKERKSYCVLPHFYSHIVIVLFSIAAPAGPTWILTPPESQRLVELGEHVVLKCEASGTPTPTITWTHNSRPLFPTDRIRIEDLGMNLYPFSTSSYFTAVSCTFFSRENYFFLSICKKDTQNSLSTHIPYMYIYLYFTMLVAGTTL